MSIITLINGKKTLNTTIFNRNNQFGDGIFETGIIEKGVFCFQEYHLTRLEKGCEKLNIRNISLSRILKDVKKAISMAKFNNCVIKIILSRGESVRGYAYVDDIQPIIMIILSPRKDSASKQNISLEFCHTGYGENKNLAKIKHCNRLEQIMAKSGLKKDEGIMLDSDKNVISVTQGNIFCYKNDTLYTPKIENCGIEGTRRHIILEIAKKLNIKTKIAKISKENFMKMEEVFITNSVMEIQSVIEIENNLFTSNATNVIRKAFIARKNDYILENIEDTK